MSFNKDITLGVLLVGTWANSVNICRDVFWRFKTIMDARFCTPSKLFRHLLVSSAIVLDTVSVIANYASVYLFDPLYVFTTAMMTLLAQSFLATKYWLLTKNNFITLILFFFITVAAGGAFASAITIVIFPQYKDRSKALIPATIWLIGEAVTDISIAFALVLKLRKMESPIKKNKSLVKSLVAQTIQTGTAGATIALVDLVAFLANKESNMTTAIAYCIGHIYCITMTLKLANLNNRKIGEMWSGTFTCSSVNPETRGGERRNQERSCGGGEYSGMRSFKANAGQGLPDDSPAVETVKYAASYASKKKQDLFTP
ncbi:hypothetical protein C8R45DRAFT_1138441 [Mycena sanguinolenta]|nr:hypothetical protein C8R45DRAFT_1138441 [Mycena sanguinolenta]